MVVSDVGIMKLKHWVNKEPKNVINFLNIKGIFSKF